MGNLSIKKILLASSSPRRKKILEDGGYKPIIIQSYGEIDIVGKKYTKELVNECAREKAVNSYEVYKKSLHENVYKDTVLVTADTVVANDGIIYGKPKDRNDAINMLKSLSGKTHIVCTAICLGFYKEDVTNILINNKEIEAKNEEEKNRIVFVTGSEETQVTFKNITDKEIEEYIDRKKPYDKAGSYGIQDENFSFVKKIDGNLDNVIGFPMKKFEEMLAKIENNIL